MRLKQANLLLGISFLLCTPSSPTALSTNYSVVQFPSQVSAIVGDNVTLKCAFSIQIKATSAKGAMSWFKGPKGTESVIIPGHRFSLTYPDTFLSPGEGLLVITNVSLEDAGNYMCQVMLWGEGEIHGNGVKLNVYARPSHPVIFLQFQAKPKSKWILVCGTDGFYPAPVWLKWYHSGLKLASFQQDCSGPTGFFQASSLLDLPHPDQRASYTCSVEHPSLSKPMSVQYFYEPQSQVSLSSSVIEVLNLLKIGVISGITIGFLIPGME
ncbi:signal-regulatory protein beta-1-like [Rhineura floridana]|uniref:signal-regulatory protein beta-1-like n=1 Tax=Rhineura floridana TaxID=261503 RepID=UPI002AC82055|nr:signal-regulatory protein beta-1-like [Rhineura floridana]